jgi:4-amino-4-deoxy-L-arabinose transferase-like glycosyltransferase
LGPLKLPAQLASRRWRPTWGVFLAALLLRSALLAAALIAGGPGSLLLGDSFEYLELAESLAAQGRFFRGGEPELLRLPAYPALLTLGVLVGHPIAVAVILQALLGAATVVWVHSMARSAAGDRAALFAGLMCACEPVTLAWGCYLMAETLLTACVTLGVLFAVRYQLTGRARSLYAACVCACAAAYVKPVAFLFPIWMALLLLGRALVSKDRGLRLQHAAAFLVLAGGLLSLWPLRNGLSAGYWGFSRQVAHLAAASVFQFEMRRGSVPVEARAALRPRPLPLLEGGAAADAAARSRVKETLLSSAPAYLRYLAGGMLRTLFAPGATTYLELFGVLRRNPELKRVNDERGAVALAGMLIRQAPAAAWLWAGLAALNAALVAMAALAFTGEPQRWRLALLAGCASYFVLASGGAWAQSRLRHPVMPSLCVLAGSALARRWPAAPRP